MWKACIFVFLMNMGLLLYFSMETLAMDRRNDMGYSGLAIALVDVVMIVILFLSPESLSG